MNNFLKAAALVTLGLAAPNTAALAQPASNTTKPTFFARRDYPGLFCLGVQVADTNGDGIPDVIVNQGAVQVLLGNGDGTFRSGPISHPAPGVQPYFPTFVATDLNGDGKTDLALVDGGIVVSLGNGDGTFPAGTVYSINDNLVFLAVGDFNGDGIPDIATAGNSGVWLLTGKGGGVFNSPVLAVSLAGGYNIAAADFNQDGKLDLAVTLPYASRTGGGFAVMLGNGDGTFQSPQTFGTPALPFALAVGSLTRGGPPSIAVDSGSNNYIYLYFGNGKGGFSGPRLVTLLGVGSKGGLAIGDVNGDGLPDLVSDAGYVAYGIGGGYFSKPVSYTIEGAEGIANVALANLRNDGRLDIVTGGYDAVSVLLNEGKGVLEDGIRTSVAGGAGCGAAADFNGDGKPDLAVNTSSGVSILLGTGKPATPFTVGTAIALAGAGCPVTGDLNGDGIPDLLVGANGSPNALYSYLGNGDGTFTLKGSTATPNSGGYVVLADFNHDGKLDFATSGNLLAFGNGDGTFQAPVAFVTNPPSTGFSGIAAGDIDNDGWPDLVLTNNGIPYNNVFVLVNNQQGGFTQVAANFGPLTYNPILADVDGDGKLDLILSQAGLGYGVTPPYGASVYVGNGSGGFTLSQTVGAQTLGPTLNMVADVNGDGILDICELAFEDTLEIYLGQGGGTYAAPFSIGTGPSPSTILTENLHGQSPTAGLPDIVAPDLSGAVVTLLNLTK